MQDLKILSSSSKQRVFTGSQTLKISEESAKHISWLQTAASI